ncbi:HPP family protein [Desulfobotulus sp. H1]|uniref:HPP family protein n=1 Tax=Desulfobotulus pelophilus TaxID=2823377 RepID=A0ABT3N640_9BACT|nr:HPP family protein [Desulfobotulus pelophilus]MCW7752910.1 HPP family protein [Desulfobotulus pelophilus]
MIFWQKLKGRTQSPPRVGIREIFWSWFSSFAGLAAVGFTHYRFLEPHGMILILGSFGASAVLIYGAIRSPLAQPRNLMGGHMLSAFVGVTAFRIAGTEPWFAAALAVSTSIALMHLTRTLHPPGGATALIAVIGGDGIHNLGYLYVLIPTGLGALIMLLIALILNNLPSYRRYPEFWW